MHNLLYWVLFNLFVLAMLALDLGVLQRPGHRVGFREAAGWSGLWVGIGIAFAALVYFWHGRPAALEFTTAYLIELSLSVDNLFVFLVIFRYFKVPAEQQHRVLFWGIIGALIMRGIFIVAGVGLIQRFHWILYVFGALLVYSGLKLMRQGDGQINPEKNPVLRVFRKAVPVTEDYVGGSFLVRRPGLYATPLLVVLLVVETTDLLFAVDSIPAVLAITLDVFIVYTSNVLAVLGLRSMYFALAGMMDLFEYLHYGLATILIFVGLKMIGSRYYAIPTGVVLGVVAGVLVVSIAVSLIFPRSKGG